MFNLRSTPVLPARLVVLSLVAALLSPCAFAQSYSAGGLGLDSGVIVSSGASYTTTDYAINITPGQLVQASSLTLGGSIGDAFSQGFLTINTATLTLSGVNTYTGGTTINGGVLVASTQNLPTQGNITLANSGILNLNQSGVATFNNSISGDGSLSVSGGGIVTLGGNNTFSGNTVVSGSTLVVSNPNNLPTSGTVTLNSGTLNFQPTGTDTYNGSIGGNGSLVVSGGTLTVNGNNSYSGNTLVNGGTLNVTRAPSLPADGNVTLSNSGTINFQSTGANNIIGSISGNGSIILSGGGIITFTGNNSYTGNTVVNGGTLITRTPGLPANGNVTLIGGTLNILPIGITTYNGSIGGNGSLNVSGGGTLTLIGNNTYTGNTVVDGSTLVTSINVLQPINANVTLSNSGTFVLQPTGTATFNGSISGAGSLNVSGGGTLILSGANTYAGNTTIGSGTLTIGSIGSIGGNLNPIVIDGGTLKSVTTGSPLVISSPISVTANNGAVNTGGGFLDLSGSTITGLHSLLTVTGGGTTTVSSALVTGLGGFAINSGTLAVNTSTASTLIANDFTISSGALLQINAPIVSRGAIPAGLVFGADNPSTVSPSNLSATLSGLITGNGTISFNGAGTLTLSNALNTFTGTFSAGAGSTILGDSSSIHGNINSSGNVTFNQTSDGTFGGNITGGATILKQGSANLTVTSSTSSPFNLQAGSLFLGNGTVGTTTVSAGSLLGGNGNVGGNLFNSGTLSPGFSPGLINVTGSYTQAPGSILVVQVASPVSFDQLVITGAATLGGTLQVDTLGGYVPASGQTFVFLTAASVTGTFNAITGSAALRASLNYNPTNVTLVFSQLPFAGFAQSPNQLALAAAALASPAATTALNTVPLASQMPAALDALSPQGYEVWSDLAFTHATFLADSLAREAGPSATNGHNRFYADGGQLRATTRDDLDVTGTTFTSSEGLVGYDRLINPGLSLGGFFAYGETTAGLGQPGGSTKVEDYTLGARAVWLRGPWIAHAVLAYDFDHYSSTRAIAFPGTAAAATSSTHGSQWTAGLSGGRSFAFGRHTLSPFVSLLATGWQADHFTESGAGSLDAAVAARSAVSLRSQLGLAGGCSLPLGSATLQPHLRAAWQHEFADDAHTIDAAFGAVSYAVQTRAPQRDSALVGAGLDLVLNPRTSLYSNFSLQAGGSTRVLGEFSAGLSVNF